MGVRAEDLSVFAASHSSSSLVHAGKTSLLLTNTDHVKIFVDDINHISNERLFVQLRIDTKSAEFYQIKTT
jgi:hypothetical protein